MLSVEISIFDYPPPPHKYSSPSQSSLMSETVCFGLAYPAFLFQARKWSAVNYCDSARNENPCCFLK